MFLSGTGSPRVVKWVVFVLSVNRYAYKSSVRSLNCIVSRVLISCRGDFLMGYPVAKEELAFSDPTPDGIKFASRYTGSSAFLVYKTAAWTLFYLGHAAHLTKWLTVWSVKCLVSRPLTPRITVWSDICNAPLVDWWCIGATCINWVNPFVVGW